MVRSVVNPPGGAEPDIELRAGTAADLPFVRDLSVEVFSQFGDYGIFLPEYLNHPSVFTTVVEDHGVPAGFIMLALVVSDDQGDGEPGGSGSEALPFAPDKRLDAEILAIAVAPSYQARGIGERLMLHALGQAEAWHSRSEGVRSVQLNVADTNERAIHFFTKMGFRVANPNDGTYPCGQRSIRMRRLC
jgi:ribosomal protein S18 acetylase RimI-like enzyme